MTRLRHYDGDNRVRFITFSTFHRFPIFKSGKTCNILIEELEVLRADHKVRIIGYVIMPDHVHLLVWPLNPVQLGVLIGQLKGRAGNRILTGFGEDIPKELAVPNRADRNYQIFQRRCYDHNCRDAESVVVKLAYCHSNPVSRGLASSPQDWKWSSFGWYNGCCDVPLQCDKCELV